MKQITALALAALIALPGATVAQEIKPLNETVSTQDFDFEGDEYGAALAAGLLLIIGGVFYFINEDDDSTTSTTGTTSTD